MFVKKGKKNQTDKKKNLTYAVPLINGNKKFDRKLDISPKAQGRPDSPIGLVATGLGFTGIWGHIETNS